MVYKKYIKKEGKLYGPYYYKSVKKNGKVTTHYIGTENPTHHQHVHYEKHSFLSSAKKPSAKFLLIAGFLIVLILALTFNLIYLLNLGLTGKASLEIKQSYLPGETLSGGLNLILKHGEFFPADSKIVVDNAGDMSEFFLKDLVSDQSIYGNFFVENSEILGAGEGYGIEGQKIVYPDVKFSFKVLDENGNDVTSQYASVSGGIGEETGGEEPGSSGEGEIDVEIVVNESVNKTEPVNESSGEVGEENVSSGEGTGSSEPGGESIAGETPAEPSGGIPEIIIPGEESGIEETPTESSGAEEATAGTESTSESEGIAEDTESTSSSESSASSESSGSTEASSETGGDSGGVTGEAISSMEKLINAKTSKDKPYSISLIAGHHLEIVYGTDKVSIESEEGATFVKTEYSETEKGYGKDYITDELYSIPIDFSGLNLIAREGTLKVSFVYNSEELVSVSEEINVLEVNETINITANETNFTKAQIIEGIISAKGFKVDREVVSELEKNDRVRVILKTREKSIGKELKGLSGYEVVELDLETLEALEGIDEIVIDEPMDLFATESDSIIRSDIVRNEFDLTGQGKKICILDTGLDSSVVPYNLGYNFVSDSDDTSDDNGHGTKVAYVAKTIAPNAEFIISKVINDAGIGYESDVLEGLQYCINQGADIISLSIGAGAYDGFCDSNIVAEFVNEIVSQGIIVMTATGNDGSELLPTPACASESLRVSASTKNDEIASFSNVNLATDVFAPGENIQTLGIGSVTDIVSGTSMAAPMAAGAAALVLENETLSPSELKERFKTTGFPVKFQDINISRIDVYNAVLNISTMNVSNFTLNETNLTLNDTFVLYYDVNYTIDPNPYQESLQNLVLVNITNSTGHLFYVNEDVVTSASMIAYSCSYATQYASYRLCKLGGSCSSSLIINNANCGSGFKVGSSNVLGYVQSQGKGFYYFQFMHVGVSGYSRVDNITLSVSGDQYDINQSVCEPTYLWLSSGSGPTSKCCGDDASLDNWSTGSSSQGCCCNGGQIGQTNDQFCSLINKYCYDGSFTSSNEVYFTGTSFPADNLVDSPCTSLVTGSNYICDGNSTKNADGVIDGICGYSMPFLEVACIGSSVYRSTGMYYSLPYSASLDQCDNNVLNGGGFVVEGLTVYDQGAGLSICDNNSICYTDTAYRSDCSACSLINTSDAVGDACDTDVSNGVYSADGLCGYNTTGSVACILSGNVIRVDASDGNKFVQGCDSSGDICDSNGGTTFSADGVCVEGVCQTNYLACVNGGIFNNSCSECGKISACDTNISIPPGTFFQGTYFCAVNNLLTSDSACCPTTSSCSQNGICRNHGYYYNTSLCNYANCSFGNWNTFSCGAKMYNTTTQSCSSVCGDSNCGASNWCSGLNITGSGGCNITNQSYYCTSSCQSFDRDSQSAYCSTLLPIEENGCQSYEWNTGGSGLNQPCCGDDGLQDSWLGSTLSCINGSAILENKPGGSLLSYNGQVYDCRNIVSNYGLEIDKKMCDEVGNWYCGYNGLWIAKGMPMNLTQMNISSVEDCSNKIINAEELKLVGVNSALNLKNVSLNVGKIELSAASQILNVSEKSQLYSSNNATIEGNFILDNSSWKFNSSISGIGVVIKNNGVLKIENKAELIGDKNSNYFLNVGGGGSPRFEIGDAKISVGRAEVISGGTFIARNSKGTIWQNDILTISGIYILDNSTLRLNGTVDGEVGVNVTSTGNMSIINGSNVTNGEIQQAKCFFIVNGGAIFLMNSSSLNNIRSSLYSWALGPYIGADSSMIKNSKFTNNYYGLIINSSNNTIYNNVFLGNNYDSLRIDGGGLNNISSNFFVNAGGIGVHISSSDKNYFFNNSYQNSTAFAITLIFSNSNYFLGEFVNRSGGGFFFTNSENNTVFNSTVFNNLGAGIGFVQSKNNTISFCNITNQAGGINFFVSDDIVESSSIVSLNYTAMSMSDSWIYPMAKVTLINTSSSKIFNFTSGAEVPDKVYVKWYVMFNVTNKTGFGVPNAKINLTSSNGLDYYSNSTIGGIIPWIPITESVYNESGETDYNNYTLNVSKTNYVTHISKHNITHSKQIDIILNGAPYVTGIVLNSSNGRNSTLENLSVYYSQGDYDNEPVNVTTDWRVNETSIAVLNMPFNLNRSTLGGEVKDYSTYKNNGTLGNITPGTNPNWTSAGKVGGAYLFDGVNDVINAGNSSSLDINNTLTIEVWIKPAKIHEDGTNYGVMAKALNPGWSWQLRFGNPNAGRRLGFQFNNGSIPGVWVNVDRNLNVGQWYHIVGTYNGTHASIYLNGILNQTKALPILYRSSSSSIIIGNEGWPGNFFNGTIDEIRIWNRSLSAEQISELYNAGLAGKPLEKIVSQETTAGENWRAALTPTDSFDDGETVLSNNLLVLNRNPEVQSVALTPDPAYTKDSLNCTFNVTDEDSNPLSVRILWYRNGQNFLNQSVDNYSVGTLNFTILDKKYTNHDYSYVCGIQGYDGEGYSEILGSNSVIVGNYSTNLNISNDRGRLGQQIKFRANYSGPYGELGRVLWYSDLKSRSIITLKFFDEDGDGIKDDIVFAADADWTDEDLENVFAYSHDGSLLWSKRISGVMDIALGDFINLNEELIAFSASGDGVIVYNKTGEEIWKASGSGGSVDIDSGDINQDGLDDIVVSYFEARMINAYFGNGTLIWSKETPSISGEVLILDDFTSSYVAATVSSRPTMIFDGITGENIFNSSSNVPYSVAESFIEKVDGDKNNLDDLFVFGLNNVVEMVNLTGGHPLEDITSMGNHFSASNGDLNGDNINDNIVFYSGSGANLSAYEINENSITSLWNFPLSEDSFNILLEDVNDAGRDYILIGEKGLNGRFLLVDSEGNSIFNFSFFISGIGGRENSMDQIIGAHKDIDSADYNNDGVEDIAIGGGEDLPSFTKDGQVVILQTSSCRIDFNDSVSADMEYNYSSGKWEYNRSFDTLGTYEYNITCEKGGYETNVSSDFLDLTNALPTVTLISPENNINTINRTGMLFEWNGYDPESDPLTYQINITLRDAGGSGGLCSDAERIFNTGTDDFYNFQGDYLRCLADDNYYYEWTARASDDGVNWGDWAEPWRINVSSFVSINLTRDIVNFGTIPYNGVDNTSDDSPLPLEIENIGNVLVNVSVNASDLWKSAGFQNPTDNFSYKVRENESNSYDLTYSAVDWRPVPDDVSIEDAIIWFNWTSQSNSAFVDILIAVPYGEGDGLRESIITFTARKAEANDKPN